jgi:hypothetical protein
MQTLLATRESSTTTVEVSVLLQRELLHLAKQHDDAAAVQASRVPYWAPYPAEVPGHRAAAALLRADAARIEALLRPGGPAHRSTADQSGDEERTGCP